MKKKDDKVGNKTGYKKKAKGKRRGRKKFRNRFVKEKRNLAYEHVRKTTKPLDYIQLAEI